MLISELGAVLPMFGRGPRAFSHDDPLCTHCVRPSLRCNTYAINRLPGTDTYVNVQLGQAQPVTSNIFSELSLGLHTFVQGHSFLSYNLTRIEFN